MADKSKTVIVKKIKKGHEGHHGGSWKVAYADFVTAMMAFFLLMWLLAMVSPEKRAALSQYFKNFSLFDKGGQTSFMQGAPNIMDKQGSSIKSAPDQAGKGAGEISAEDIKERLKKAVEDKLRALKDQVMLEVFEGGVRIQLVDTDGSSLFPSGSAQPSEKARQVLKLVAENIKDTRNRIAVEGHTDAAPLKSGLVTNWELSTQRASAARRELEADGIDPGRIARVVGYADTEPLIKDNPKDPRNRRISIILLQQKVPPPPPPPDLIEAKPQTKPEPQPRPVQPAPPAEQPKKPQVEAPALRPQPIEVKQAPALKPPQPAGQTKKPPAGQYPAKQEQKKGISDSDIGIKSKKPIDIGPLAPGIGK
ncbi:MAG TPA: flagellar motor protein MotB [Dissulfurispiraceae bacterium]